jgi:hypothetical protein
LGSGDDQCGGSVLPGSYLVDRINADRYYLILDAGVSGWVLAAGGQIAGACDSIAM